MSSSVRRRLRWLGALARDLGGRLAVADALAVAGVGCIAWALRGVDDRLAAAWVGACLLAVAVTIARGERGA